LTGAARAGASIGAMNAFWDQRYAEPGYKYGTEPNAWLRAQAHRLAPGSRVLVPGDGEGRNSVWLAQHGHRVLAMDSSAVGLAKAQALARQRGVVIDTQLADLADWVPAPGAADAVVLVFVHLPSALRAIAHRRLAQALRPGGLMLVEAFHPRQLGRSSGGPKDPDMLVDLATLRADWCTDRDDGLDEIEAWEGEVALAEGPGHQGLGWVSRWLGRQRAAT